MSEPKIFTQEQLDRIATNKAKALQRLSEKRKAETPIAPKKAKWIKTFYEYDLTTLVDSKGGFIIDETDGNKEFNEEKKRSYIIEPYYRKVALFFWYFALRSITNLFFFLS